MPGEDGKTVFIVHPDPVVRDALTLALGYRGFSLLQYASLSDFLSRRPIGAPGCAVVCLQQFKVNGYFVDTLPNELADHPVVLIAERASAADVRAGFLAGASDVLPDGFATEDFVTSIHRALQRVRTPLPNHPEPVAIAAGDALTPREVEIARWVRQGYDNRTIAQRLGISHRTVEVHKTRLMRKLGVRTLPELIARTNRSVRAGRSR